MKMFMSDNNAGVDSRILEYIGRINKDHTPSYGSDEITKKAIDSISKLFDKDVDVYFVTSGTAANVIGLGGLIKPFEAVVCTDTAHINEDECGAFERFTNSKILTVPHENGKISIDNIKTYLGSVGDEHQSQPRVISISQTSERGTLYDIEEIRALAEFAHANNMYLHMDGARIANAVVGLNSTFKEMVTDTGVDLLSFGGTKNGMMIGEAIVSFNKEISKDFKYYRKQGMQLLSKMRFVSGQFIPYIEDGIWEENARKANDMGKYLMDGLSTIGGVELEEGLKTNMVFLYMDKEKRRLIEKAYDFHILDDARGLIRLVTSFDTEKEEIDKFINMLR